MGLFSTLAKAMGAKIGIVIGGDYKGAQVGYGTKSTKTTVSVRKNDGFTGGVNQNEALIFFTKPNEYRFDSTDITSYTVKSSDNTTTTYEIAFKDGKKSLVQISNQYKHKIDSALYS